MTNFFSGLWAKIKSLFTKEKSDMTDIVAAADTAKADVETVLATLETDIKAAVAPAVSTATVTIDSAAATIKAFYDKLGINLPAWDGVIALAKVL